MKHCYLTISTTVDGQESNISKEGKIRIADSFAEICYYEENAVVTLVLKEEKVKITRRGDYSMELTLEREQTHEGKLGIGDAAGEIKTRTKKLAYAVHKDSVLLSLHYELLFGTESQNMRLRLYAKEI